MSPMRCMGHMWEKRWVNVASLVVCLLVMIGSGSIGVAAYFQASASAAQAAKGSQQANHLARKTSRLAHRIAKLARLGAEAHRAACASKGQLRHAYKTGVRYLKQHPEGLPALHFTAAQFARELADEKRRLRNLRVVHCRKHPPVLWRGRSENERRER